MGFLENTLAFVFVLGVMVLIHELGHFWAALYFNVRVDSFAFGFGPRLFGFKRGETDYRVCLLPLGGYVKMAGEAIGEPTGDPREFLSKPRWQRLIIAFMGPLFNMILAVVLLAGLYLFHFERFSYWEQPALVAAVSEGSSAEKAGIAAGDSITRFDGAATPNWESVRLAEIAAVARTLEVEVSRNGRPLTFELTVDADDMGAGRAGWIAATDVRLDPMEGSAAESDGVERGDVIKAIDGLRILQVEQALEAIRGSEGRELQFELERDGRLVTVGVTPLLDEASDPEDPAYRIGAYIGPKRTILELGVGEAISQAVKDNVNNATLIFGFLRGLVEQRMSAKSLEGPIGIARLSGEAARQGWPDLLMLMANISLNLGIFNLLPIPILDGGVILLLLGESLMRRDFSLVFKERFVQAGLVFLVLVFTFVIYNDILKSLPDG